MRNLGTTAFATLMLAAAGLIGAGMKQPADDDTEAVRSAAAGFYTALNAMFTGDLGPMKGVWSHASDVTYMGPDGGFQVGWNRVLADWEKQAALKLGGRVDAGEMRITVGRDLAITHNYELGKNIVDGKPVTVSIRATNVFRKESGTWKMIGHHTDPLHFLDLDEKIRDR